MTVKKPNGERNELFESFQPLANPHSEKILEENMRENSKVEILKSIKDEEIRKKVLDDIESEENMDKLSKALSAELKICEKVSFPVSKPSSSGFKRRDSQQDDQKLAKFCEKMHQKLSDEAKNHKTVTTIDANESFRIFREHERRTHEYQMQQAAKKLTGGQAISYEFSPSVSDLSKKKSMR